MCKVSRPVPGQGQDAGVLPSDSHGPWEQLVKLLRLGHHELWTPPRCRGCQSRRQKALLGFSHRICLSAAPMGQEGMRTTLLLTGVPRTSPADGERAVMVCPCCQLFVRRQRLSVQECPCGWQQARVLETAAASKRSCAPACVAAAAGVATADVTGLESHALE